MSYVTVSHPFLLIEPFLPDIFGGSQASPPYSSLLLSNSLARLCSFSVAPTVAGLIVVEITHRQNCTVTI